MKINILEKVEYEFDENNSKHCYQWITDNCSDYSFFPSQGKIIYKNNGYEVTNIFDGNIYVCLYKEIKNKNIKISNVSSKLNYFMSYGGNFKKLKN